MRWQTQISQAEKFGNRRLIFARATLKFSEALVGTVYTRFMDVKSN